MTFAVKTRELRIPENMNEKSNAEIWKDTIALMETSLKEVSEEDKAAYEQRIRQKMQSGKKLTSEEMNFLRIYQPELYRSAVRVETARKILRTKLKNCKSKEEVENIVSAETEAARAAKETPDGEYLAAMVRNEVETFKQSSAYRRLPQRREKDENKKRPVMSDREIWKDEEGQSSSNKLAVLGQLQIQCEMINQMSSAFVM